MRRRQATEKLRSAIGVRGRTMVLDGRSQQLCPTNHTFTVAIVINDGGTVNYILDMNEDHLPRGTYYGHVHSVSQSSKTRS